VASGIFRHQWMLCIHTLASVLAATATAATPSDQSPATTPQTAATQPASAESPAAPAGNSASNAKPANASVHKVVLIDNDVNDEQLKQILAKGYRPESRNGTTVYCRKEAVVGTRFETKTCSTSKNILETEQRSKDVTTNAQRNNGMPMGR
jgi:hypothetical protein